MDSVTQEALQQTEAKRIEAAAHRFFDMAEKINPYMEAEAKKREMFESVGSETASANFDKAQRILESGVQWDDALRGAAFEVNKLDRERTGEKPLSFEEAQAAMSGYARNFEEMSKESGGKQQDLESAMEIDDIVGDIPESGIEGVDNALEYIEGTLRSKGNIADSILGSNVTTPEGKAQFLEDWQKKRAIRDALYQEKQKRIEQLKQSQQAAEEANKGRASALSNIENLYAQAGVPEDTPSRQEFLRKMQRMSPDELYFLGSALGKASAEFSRTGDSKLLDGFLMGLNGFVA